MNEKIIRIEEGSWSSNTSSGWKQSYDGFLIVTEEQTIKVGIDNGQNCCESWGYLASQDDLSGFSGAVLLNIKVTDAELRAYTVDELPTKSEWEGGSAMFVDFETDRGVFQIVAYNSHNGYYGHEAVVISRDLNYEEYL